MATPPLAYIQDHEARAIATLSAWALADPNIVAFVGVDGARFQALEIWLQTYMTLLTLDGAGVLDPSGLENIWLDRIGLIVGEGRQGSINSVYTQRLRAAILRNHCQGDAEGIIAVIAALLTPNIVRTFITDVYPASMVINVNSSAPLTAAEEANLIRFALDCKLGGVRIVGLSWSVNPVFAWAGYPSPPGKGFDDGTGTAGGYWAHYIYP